jgi:hypothetical protein
VPRVDDFDGYFGAALAQGDQSGDPDRVPAGERRNRDVPLPVHVAEPLGHER